MTRITEEKNTIVILLPRNPTQAKEIGKNYNYKNLIIPASALDGLKLVIQADLVIGGGGTMTREAAAVGTPSYSFFRGQMGSVDTQLEREKRLIMLRSTNDIESKLRISKKDANRKLQSGKSKTLDSILLSLQMILQQETGHPISAIRNKNKSPNTQPSDSSNRRA